MSKTGRKPNDMSPEAQARRQKAAKRLTEIKSQWVNAHKTADNKRGALVSEFAARLTIGESTLRGYCGKHCTHNLPDDLAKKLAEIWKELTGETTIPEYWQGKTDQKDLDGYASERKKDQIHHEIRTFDEASRQTASM